MVMESQNSKTSIPTNSNNVNSSCGVDSIVSAAENRGQNSQELQHVSSVEGEKEHELYNNNKSRGSTTLVPEQVFEKINATKSEIISNISIDTPPSVILPEVSVMNDTVPPRNENLNQVQAQAYVQSTMTQLDSTTKSNEINTSSSIVQNKIENQDREAVIKKPSPPSPSSSISGGSTNSHTQHHYTTQQLQHTTRNNPYFNNEESFTSTSPLSAGSNSSSLAPMVANLSTQGQNSKATATALASMEIPISAAPSNTASNNNSKPPVSQTTPRPLSNSTPTHLPPLPVHRRKQSIDTNVNIQPQQYNNSNSDSSPAIVEKSPGNRYIRFTEVLGNGAYKTVYRAYDTVEGIEVAWNVVNLSGTPKSDRNRIVNEVRLLERLNHKNIISFYGSWVNRELEQVIFVTEILSSGTLKSFIQKVQVIRWRIAKRWAIQILEGLEYLHSQDPPVIHRDLKCDNIFINGTSGDLRIGDFGLSTNISNLNSKKALSVLGTPEFMAPELYDEIYDEKVDIYAFGMCLLEIFTKEVPYAECLNPAQIYKKVTKGIPPQSLSRVRSQEARDFISLCISEETTVKSRPSAKELLKHIFLQENENDDLEVEVDPPFSEDITEKNEDEFSTSSILVGAPGPAPNGPGYLIQGGVSSQQNVVHQMVTTQPQNDHVSLHSNSNEASLQSSTNMSRSAEEQLSSMPDSEINIKNVTVLMGRGQEIESSSAGIPSAVGTSTSNEAPPVPTQVMTNSSFDLQADMMSTNNISDKKTNNNTIVGKDDLENSVSSTSPNAPVKNSSDSSTSAMSKSTLNNPGKYVVSGSVTDPSLLLNQGDMDGSNKSQSELIKITLELLGTEEIVEFHFHLVTDDPVQVAREMVTELHIPETSVLEISEKISGLAREARVNRDMIYKLRQQQQQQQKQQAKMRTYTIRSQSEHQLSTAAPIQSQNLPRMSIPQHQRLQQQQPPSSSSSPLVDQQKLLNSPLGVNFLSGTSDEPPERPPPAQMPSIPTSLPEQQQKQHSTIDLLSDDMVDSSQLTSQLQSKVQLFASDQSYSTDTSNDDSTSSSYLDNDGDSEEISKLREEYEKNKAFASKAYETRMDNLQRSMESKETELKQTIEKLKKNGLEFEKKKKNAELEQNKRLEQLKKKMENDCKKIMEEKKKERKERRLAKKKLKEASTNIAPETFQAASATSNTTTTLLPQTTGMQNTYPPNQQLQHQLPPVQHKPSDSISGDLIDFSTGDHSQPTILNTTMTQQQQQQHQQNMTISSSSSSKNTGIGTVPIDNNNVNQHPPYR